MSIGHVMAGSIASMRSRATTAPTGSSKARSRGRPTLASSLEPYARHGIV